MPSASWLCCSSRRPGWQHCFCLCCSAQSGGKQGVKRWWVLTRGCPYCLHWCVCLRVNAFAYREKPAALLPNCRSPAKQHPLATQRGPSAPGAVNSKLGAYRSPATLFQTVSWYLLAVVSLHLTPSSLLSISLPFWAISGYTEGSPL